MNTYFFSSRISILLVLSFLSLSSSAQQLLSFEPAGTIPKKTVSATLSASALLLPGFGAGYAVTPQVGVGITNNFDLSLATNISENMVPNFMITPKVAILKNKLSVSMPINVAFVKEYDFYAQSYETKTMFLLQPRLIGGHRLSKGVDITALAEGIIDFENTKSFIVGGNIGMGFSSNLDRWAIRPEFGYWLAVDSNEPPSTTMGLLKFGLGFNYRFGKVAN